MIGNADFDSYELTAGYLAKELECPFSSKGVVVPEITICHPKVRHKNIDGFTKTMLKTATNSILLLVLARWDS